MAAHLSNGNYKLICVAHPDDETLFFGGLIQQRRDNNQPWLIVCVTFDGKPERKTHLSKAAKSLQVEHLEHWDFPDKYDQRLPLEKVSERLRDLPTPAEVFTHNMTGEYGHPHHQDVCMAVHQAFPDHPNVFSVAYNSFPEIEVRLTQAQFNLKAEILTNIYPTETRRFLNLLPVTFTEGFHRNDARELKAVYDFLAYGKELDVNELKAYHGLVQYLPQLRDLPRPF